jgi:NodT family efflux transporter outer membrane factor (OMF) lipoprotein
MVFLDVGFTVKRPIPFAVLALAGCATQAPWTEPVLSVPPTWSVEVAPPAAASSPAAWWRALKDAPLSAFVESTLAENPTLAQAVARIDEARAQLGVNDAARLPSVALNAAAGRAKGLDTTGASANGITIATSASIGASLGWEPDLFGRIRLSVEAARRRLDARTADAQAVRLSLAADTVGNVIALRACRRGRAILAEDIRSRERALALVRERVAAGAAAPVDEARSRSGLANARTALAARDEQCAHTVNALVALSGADSAAVGALVPAEVPASNAQADALAVQPFATVPTSALELPARVLMQHPTVRAAENEAAAAWAEIGVARADRWPRIDLAAALSGQWLRAAGDTLRYTAWSLGPSVSGALFDGGAGAARVDAAEARYRTALAALRQAVRVAALDVENALAADGSAQARAALTQASVDAARQTFVATQGQWQAGAVSLFELEDARRQLASALDGAVAAERDRAQAWVALVRASGNALSIAEQGTP